MKPDEVRISYAMFRELWKRLVSKRKALKFEVDRHIVWQRLASGHLELRERAVGSNKAAAEEWPLGALSLDDARQMRQSVNMPRVNLAPDKPATPKRAELGDMSTPIQVATKKKRGGTTIKHRRTAEA